MPRDLLADAPPTPKASGPRDLLAARAPAPEAEPEGDRSLGDKFWNDTFWGGMMKSIGSAVTLPGDVFTGKVDPNSDEAIGRAADLAGMATPVLGGRMAAPAAKAAEKAIEPGTRQAVTGAAERLGVQIPRAAASDNIITQQAGQTVANVPVVGSPLRKASKQAIGQLDDAARVTQQGYGSGSPAIAGDAAREGVTGYIKETLPKRIAEAYAPVDDLVDPAITTRLAKTAEVASRIGERRGAARIRGGSKAVDEVAGAIADEQGLTYQGLKDLRSRVGEMLDNPSALPSDMSGAELKQIYGALTDDLRSAVQAAGGPKALAAWEKANASAASIAKEREALNRLLGAKNDEGLFDRLIATAGSTSRADQKQLLRARAAVSDETWNEVAGAVVAKLGRGPDDAFSPDRFVTAYGKLSTNGKNALFNGRPELRQALDDIAEVSTRFKKLKEYANPSGTGQSMMSGGLAAWAISEPVSALSTVVGGRALASYLAQPAKAKAVAEWSRAYLYAAEKGTPASRSMLERRTQGLVKVLGNEDVRALAAPTRTTAGASALKGASGEVPQPEQGERQYY